MRKFLSLGAECVKIQEAAHASQGMSLVLVVPSFTFIHLFL
jgi:hypothetical protein